MGIDRQKMTSQKAVFLDRDGVINAAIVHDGLPYPPQSIDTLRIIPGVSQALEKLKSLGFLTVVFTNQPDVSRGKQTQEEVENINNLLKAQLPLDSIKTCYHSDSDKCQCRKPLPGMILEASRELGIDLGKSFVVGDRWRDIDAGKAAGCRTFFIDYGYSEKRPEPDWVVQSLLEATQIIAHLESQSIG
ncbi:MAG: HAD family hydrolase [Oligoflexia bacterium]|nr:HAD family hydrolase [Oligoflexia bacterium]